MRRRECVSTFPRWSWKHLFTTDMDIPTSESERAEVNSSTRGERERERRKGKTQRFFTFSIKAFACGGNFHSRRFPVVVKSSELRKFSSSSLSLPPLFVVSERKGKLWKSEKTFLLPLIVTVYCVALLKGIFQSFKNSLKSDLKMAYLPYGCNILETPFENNGECEMWKFLFLCLCESGKSSNPPCFHSCCACLLQIRRRLNASRSSRRRASRVHGVCLARTHATALTLALTDSTIEASPHSSTWTALSRTKSRWKRLTI